jgi:hypothetical protein
LEVAQGRDVLRRVSSCIARQNQRYSPTVTLFERVTSSGGIIDTLNGLLEKGETQLNTATETETTNKNNFDQLKQSLTDEIKFANKDMDDAKKGLAESHRQVGSLLRR